MSAYILKNSSINQIVSGIEYATRTGSDSLLGIPAPCSELLNFENPADFGQALHDMNEQAVRIRYQDDYPLPGSTQAYLYAPGDLPSLVQLYKTIQGFLYQCFEGDVYKSPLYQALEEYKNDLACYFVDQSSLYQKAKWPN